MNELELEQKLRSFDYSSLYSIRDTLKETLLSMHQRDNQSDLPCGAKWQDKRFGDDEQDYATAAGASGRQEKEEKT